MPIAAATGPALLPQFPLGETEAQGTGLKGVHGAVTLVPLYQVLHTHPMCKEPSDLVQTLPPPA